MVMAELIIGTIPRNPPIRLLSMPPTTMLFAIGIQMMILEILRLLAIPAPFRISSLPQGAPLRPALYSIIEDVCAVDGSGGTEFRQRLNLRFLASKHFRVMLHRLTLFWSFGAMIIATVVTGVVFGAPSVSGDAAYIVSATFDLRSSNCSGWMDCAFCLGWPLCLAHHLLRKEGTEARETNLGRRPRGCNCTSESWCDDAISQPWCTCALRKSRIQSFGSRGRAWYYNKWCWCCGISNSISYRDWLSCR
jgi:hypothetical protein